MGKIYSHAGLRCWKKLRIRELGSLASLAGTVEDLFQVFTCLQIFLDNLSLDLPRPVLRELGEVRDASEGEGVRFSSQQPVIKRTNVPLHGFGSVGARTLLDHE